MSTDIGLQTTNFQVGNLSWKKSRFGDEYHPNITIDTAVGFVSGTHYPNGFIPSGTPLGKITASGLYALYDNAAADGREVLAGHLIADIRVVRADGTTAAQVGSGLMIRGDVIESRLPFAVDAAGKADVAGRIRYE